MKRATVWCLVAVVLVVVGAAVRAAPSQVRNPPESPLVLETDTLPIRVVPVAKGLLHPWSFVFLPDGSMLVTERAGRLRIVRDGVLDANPISGVPPVLAAGLQGLMGLALHPKFAENKLIYLSYSKPTENGLTATALARGRLEGGALIDVRDIFVSSPWVKPIPMASSILFGPDGMLYMSVGGAINAKTTGLSAQDPNSHVGKLLRLRDDGSVPKDNPFVGQAGYKPEIFSLGHRNQLGLAFHPDADTLWASENGPQGGDEINVILPGHNYGWPIATFGREYSGARITETTVLPGMDSPRLYWVPSIGATGMVFYTGDRFSAWKGHLLVGGLSGRGLYRIKFNKDGFEDTVKPREPLLTELRQRIRDVRQGPDGLVYVLTDGYVLNDAGVGVILRLEPAQ